jgi:hypothetical protein
LIESGRGGRKYLKKEFTLIAASVYTERRQEIRGLLSCGYSGTGNMKCGEDIPYWAVNEEKGNGALGKGVRANPCTEGRFCHA